VRGYGVHPECQLKCSALQHVTVDETGRLDRLPVDECAVEAPLDGPS
jgi:hypothetical protein